MKDNVYRLMERRIRHLESVIGSDAKEDDKYKVKYKVSAARAVDVLEEIKARMEILYGEYDTLYLDHKPLDNIVEIIDENIEYLNETQLDLDV